MHERHVTLNVFCKRHPKLAAEARALVAAGAVVLDSEGKVSERLLETAVSARNGGAKVGRYTTAALIR